MSDLISEINAIAHLYYKEFAMNFLDLCPEDIKNRVLESRTKIVKRQWKLHAIVLLLTFITCMTFYLYAVLLKGAPGGEGLLFVALSAVLPWAFWFTLLFAIDNIRGRNDAYNLFYEYTKEHQVRIVMEVKKGNQEKIFNEIRKILNEKAT